MPGGGVRPGGAEADHRGTVYVLRGRSLEPLRVRTGLSDGSFTAVYPAGDSLNEGDPVVIGTTAAPVQSTNMPPGMGGSRFGGRR
jgi:hypothetical protein